MKNETKNSSTNLQKKSSTEKKDNNKLDYMVIDATASVTMPLGDWSDLLYLLNEYRDLPVSQLLAPDIQKILDNAKIELGSLYPLVQ